VWPPPKIDLPSNKFKNWSDFYFFNFFQNIFSKNEIRTCLKVNLVWTLNIHYRNSIQFLNFHFYCKILSDYELPRAIGCVREIKFRSKVQYFSIFFLLQFWIVIIQANLKTEWHWFMMMHFHKWNVLFRNIFRFFEFLTISL
jgi:hypothetical protein